MTDQGFPIIEYRPQQTPRERGRMHGEQWRTGVQELSSIRMDLMRARNPWLTEPLAQQLAAEQWAHTQAATPDLAEELEGICEGASASLTDIVVLNNYTDFRDISLPDEGCSVVFVNHDDQPIAGQTWDMHRSAKNYVCCIHIAPDEDHPEMVLFSLTGCVGMMGYSSRGHMVGVNNINTDNAEAGVMWPVLVRKTLAQSTHQGMADSLTQASVTSGHNYLLASRQRAEMWEVMPRLAECVSSLSSEDSGSLFHTNHCLGAKSQLRELPASQNSTTHIRFDLLEKKIPAARTWDDVYGLLNDHENYPKSICSNFQSDSQDPSVTCGGAVGHLSSGRVVMWRGDAEYDANFVEHEFHLSPTAD